MTLMESMTNPAIKRILLDVAKDNGGARRFHEKLGFVATGQTRDYRQITGLTRMEKPSLNI